MDNLVPGRESHELLSDDMGRVPYRSVANAMGVLVIAGLIGWLTGQLYLGAFSGPVEGILMVVGIYCISGYYGS